MFSKALFKQSCKANSTMWIIITIALCFMLAFVMLISGNGSISDVKNSIQDTIINKEIDSQLQKRAINYYTNGIEGMEKFDEFFVSYEKENLAYLSWLGQKPERSNFEDDETYGLAVTAWQEAKPTLETTYAKDFEKSVNKWLNQQPKRDAYENDEEYLAAVTKWQGQSVATTEAATTNAYKGAVEEVKKYVYRKAASINKKYTIFSKETQELLGSVMYAINPNGTFNKEFTSKNEEAPADYDVVSLINHIVSGDIETYLESEERQKYHKERAEINDVFFVAYNMTQEDNVEVMLSLLSSYGVTPEKYESFGYTYENVKDIAASAVISYHNRLDYELNPLIEKLNKGELSHDEFVAKKTAVIETLTADISSSLLTSLPDDVANALEEVGQMDLYTLIVGDIFYKLAGLLLPIIFMIMVSNNLISGQVDSGSMAYVLSTSTKRNTIVFTQAIYLIGSLFAMFFCTSVTGCICLAIIKDEVSLTFGKLLLLNVGAFLVLFALSGLCFFTSCWFDRSKHSMALGGGLSIFALVAAMLGLFGSPIIPSVIRLDALNLFNYTTIITLFDVVSICDGTTKFIIQFGVLLVMGLVGYIIGSLRFIKKDLPL